MSQKDDGMKTKRPATPSKTTARPAAPAPAAPAPRPSRPRRAPADTPKTATEDRGAPAKTKLPPRRSLPTRTLRSAEKLPERSGGGRASGGRGKTALPDLENAETTTFLPVEPEISPEVPTERQPRQPARAPTVVAQIRELEAQLDRLIDEASRRDLSSLADPDEDDEPDEDDGSDLEITRDASPEMMARFSAARGDPEGLNETQEIARVEPPPARPSIPRPSAPESRTSSPSLGPNEATVFDTARELLSSDFYLRKWGRLAMRGRSEEVDDFGFDPIYDQKARSVLEFLYTRYFRVETTGIDRVPARGRCLLVANHSGTLPLDGVMIKTAVKLEHASPRDVRWLTEDFIYHMPYLGSIMNRLGAVRACQENAQRLLEKEMLCAVFPEGVKGIGKLFGERYRLQRFGRGGFIKLCLRTNTPIIPVAVVGAEETNPLLFRIEYLSKALGLPYVPVTPTFPALGPLGLLPAPTKWQIHFGEPIDVGGHGADAAEDELLVGKLAERVRATIQGMLDRAVGSRKSVFFG